MQAKARLETVLFPLNHQQSLLSGKKSEYATDDLIGLTATHLHHIHHKESRQLLDRSAWKDNRTNYAVLAKKK